MCGVKGKFCSPERKLVWWPPFFILSSKRLYKSLWNKNKTLRLLMPDFLKVHSIAFYIELSSKYVGVGVNFGLLKEN